MFSTKSFNKKSELKKAKLEKREREERRQRIEHLKQNANLTMDEQLNAYKQSLNPLGRLIPASMLKMYYEIGTSAKDVNASNNIMLFLFILISFAVMFFSIILNIKFKIAFILIFGLIGGILFLFNMNLKNKSDDINAEKQKRFNLFTQITIPHLQSLKEGEDISSILEKVKKKTHDEFTINMIDRLSFEIFRNPNDKKPFQRFSKDMSATAISDQFMDNIYQMSQGNTNTESVQYLADLSSKQLEEASQMIADSDTSVMDMVLPFLLYLFFVILLVFLASSMVTLLHQIVNEV